MRTTKGGGVPTIVRCAPTFASQACCWRKSRGRFRECPAAKKHLQIFLFIKKSCIFAVSMLIQKDKKMTAGQVNAQNIKLLQGIGAIADSEPLMNRLSKYVERLLS